MAPAGPSASAIFYWTLLFIFLTAVITTVVTKWARDKVLKFFDGYHVTIQRGRGLTLWGRLKVFSSGLEVVYDHPYIDNHGRQKNSYMFYQAEVEQQVLSIVRFHDELTPQMQQDRLKQIRRTFNPGFFRRAWRGLRNLINTLRDGFNAAVGAVVTQFQRTNPAAVLATQSGAVTNIGQTILGRVANAYEPLLEQYIGRPVIIEVADAINPNNVVHEYVGYLADYTQQFVAVFSVDHPTGEKIEVTLPDVGEGDVMPPLPPPPPMGAPPPALPAPLAVEQGLAMRIDGKSLRIQNTRGQMLAARRLEREGGESLALKMVLPPMGTLILPARDARSGKLICEVIQAADLIAPRRFAIVRHAGHLLERRGLIELDELPLVSRLFAWGDGEDRK